MESLSEISKLRKYYLKEQKVPTQSVIRATMSDKLADVLFKSLSPKFKGLSGFDHPIKGAGNNWVICPKQNLDKSKAVLKPLDDKHFAKFNHTGIEEFGEQALLAHQTASKKERDKIVYEADIAWRNKIKKDINEYWKEKVKICERCNADRIRDVFHLFSDVYQKSFKKIEKVFHEAIKSDVETTLLREQMLIKKRYNKFYKIQLTRLTEKFENKINKEKARLKAEFINNVENSRTDMATKVHDLNADKHEVYESMRKFLECQKIACQLYVLLKEKEECLNEIKELKYKHNEHVQTLTEQTKWQDVEIRLAEQKEKKQVELNSMWIKKVRHVVDNFQKFITYSLHVLPQQAEFFINMEKLILLQLNEALDNPSAENIFEPEKELFHTPLPQAKPFYLFCDKRYEAKIDQDVCLKQRPSDSMLPAVIINGRCLYAACGNFAQFTDEIKDYSFMKHVRNADVNDDIDYGHVEPVKYSETQQLFELKLQSSLMNMLQHELSGINNVPSRTDDISNYYNTFFEDSDILSCENEDDINEASVPSTSEKRVIPFSEIRHTEHERESKLKSYFEYESAQTRDCIRKPVVRIPPYMMGMSKYGTLELPNYETCSEATLKKMVKKARKEGKLPQGTPKAISKVKDAATQYFDEEFNYICQCLGQSNFDTENPVPI